MPEYILSTDIVKPLQEIVSGSVIKAACAVAREEKEKRLVGIPRLSLWNTEARCSRCRRLERL